MSGRCFHMALSVDVDRFDDRYITEQYLSGARVNGRKIDVAEFRKLCAEHRAKGLAVFPPCGNTKRDGSCAGHTEAEFAIDEQRSNARRYRDEVMAKASGAR